LSSRPVHGTLFVKPSRYVLVLFRGWRLRYFLCLGIQDVNKSQPSLSLHPYFVFSFNTHCGINHHLDRTWGVMKALIVGECVVSLPAQSWRRPQKASTLACSINIPPTSTTQFSHYCHITFTLLCSFSTTILFYPINTNRSQQWTTRPSSLRRPSVRPLTLRSPKSHW
jgi:hypothetical protein